MAFCAYPPLQRKRYNRMQPLRCSVSSSSEKVQESTNADLKTNEFKPWSEKNGIKMPSITLTNFGSEAKGVAQRGMLATSPIREGDLLMSVERKKVLQVTSLDMKQSPFPEKVSSDTWRKLPWYVRLALRTADCQKDQGHELHLWASLLPTSIDLPHHWSDSQLAELQNTRLINAIAEQRKEYKKWYDLLNKANNPIMRGWKYSDFVRAVDCVRSRAFQGPLELAPFKERLRLFVFIAANVFLWPALNALPLENALNGGLTALFALLMYDVLTPKIVKFVQGVELQRYAMTPGIDFFNHNCRVTDRANVSYEYFSDRFEVRSGEDYDVGHEVFISYGSQSNDAFLQYYGFVEPDNPSETFTFDPSVEHLLGVTQKSLVAKRKGFDNKVVEAVARKLNGSRSAAETALRELCEAEVNAMATTLDEDETLLRSGTVKCARHELAIRYRIEKKKLLDHIISMKQETG